MISQKELAMSMQITHNGQRILTCRLPRLWHIPSNSKIIHFKREIGKVAKNVEKWE